MRARERTTRLLVASAIAALAFSLLAPMSATADAVIGTIDVGPAPFGVAFSPDSTIAYVTVAGDSKVAVVDVESQIVIRTINLASAGATSMRGIDISPDGSRIYATDLTGLFFVVDPVTGAILNTVTLSVPGQYNDVTVSPSGHEAWLADFIGGIAIVDLTPGAEAEITTLALGSGMPAVVFSLDGSLAYAPSGSDDLINVFDVATHTLLPTPIVGNPGAPMDEPLGMVLMPDGLTALVVSRSDSFLNSVDLTTGVVTQIVPIGSDGFGVAVNDQGSKAVVSNQADSTVTIVNLFTNTAAPPVVTDDGPTSVIMSPSGDRAYVTNLFSTVLTVIGVDTVPTIDPAPLPSATAGEPFSYTLETSGYPDPVFSVSSGALPPGLTLDPATGTVSGTPTGAGTFSFTITATNVNGTNSVAFTLAVAAGALASGGSESTPVLALGAAGLLLGLALVVRAALRRRRAA